MAIKKKTTKIPSKKSSKSVWIWMCVIIFIVVISIFGYVTGIHHQSRSASGRGPAHVKLVASPFDFENQKYVLDDRDVSLHNGVYKSFDGQQTSTIAEQVISASRMKAAAVVIDQPGGSGSFYYLIGAMKKGGNDIYSQPISLGDRIKIVSVVVQDAQDHDNGEIVVDYLDHAADSSMAAEPTIQIIKKFAFEENGNLVEVLH
jgi:hypothetical protein